MRALPVIETHSLSDTDPGLRSGFPGVQVDPLVFERTPQPLDEDIVEEPSLAITRGRPGADLSRRRT
ncbi:hypothetical protein IWQ48_005854 [Labrenzia sp. EL_13]|nr:hypothetical protein [Labrenzia sp. EL_13]